MEKGDVIYLNSGEIVKSIIPSVVVNGNKSDDWDYLIRKDVVIGQLLKSTTGGDVQLKKVTFDIINAFSKNKFNIDYEDAMSFVKSKVESPEIEHSFIAPEGEYLVIDAKMDGGSTDGGMSGHDSWPNGFHIYCKKLTIHGEYDPNGIEIDFWQTGIYTPILNKLPIRSMSITYK